MSDFGLKGRTAVITGAGGGLGRTHALLFAKHGANVVVNDLGGKQDGSGKGSEMADKVVAEIKAAGGNAVANYDSVSTEAGANGIVKTAVDTFGKIDILVNNAGINITRLAEEFSADDWRRIIDTNLIGAYQLCQQVYPHMKSSGGGKIINISSMTAIFGSKRSIPYGASKSGLTALTRSLAVSWAADNIQVNAILPGWVETELTIGLRESEDPEIKHIWRSINDRIPAARWAKPDDMAGAAVFLASAAADYITGAALPVDGGYSIA